MNAIGTTTGTSMPAAAMPPPVARVPLAGSNTLAPAPAAGPSGVAGMDLSGNPLTDRVLRTFAADPFGAGALGGAVDRVSAQMSFDPTSPLSQQPRIPGTDVRIDPHNALDRLDPAAAAKLPTSEFIARSQSGLAGMWGSFTQSMADGAGAHGSLSSFADSLRGSLRPGNAFDAKLASLEGQKQELFEQLKANPGDARTILATILSLTVEQELVRREREKREELLKLIISLLIGVQVPKGCVERLKALGLGNVVEQLIRELVGNGAGLSKSMNRQLHDLAGMGIQVNVVQPHDTDEGLREAERARILAAKPGSDGRLTDERGHTVGEAAASDNGLRLRRDAAISTYGAFRAGAAAGSAA